MRPLFSTSSGFVVLIGGFFLMSACGNGTCSGPRIGSGTSRASGPSGADGGIDTRLDPGADTARSASRPAADPPRPSALPSPSGAVLGSFDPCPGDGSPCRILPLGDSITDGVGSSGGGYRVPLFRLAARQGKKITFVGRNTNGPSRVDGVAFPGSHEGYSGYTIDDSQGRAGITRLVPGALLASRPHVVLLMIGTNDVGIDHELQGAPRRLAALVDLITRDVPGALLVVAQIVPSQDDAFNARARAYNTAIAELVSDRARLGKHVILADMYSAFVAHPNYRTSLLVDMVHPSDAGYAEMAKVWYGAMTGHNPR